MSNSALCRIGGRGSGWKAASGMRRRLFLDNVSTDAIDLQRIRLPQTHSTILTSGVIGTLYPRRELTPQAKPNTIGIITSTVNYEQMGCEEPGWMIGKVRISRRFFVAVHCKLIRGMRADGPQRSASHMLILPSRKTIDDKLGCIAQ